MLQYRCISILYHIKLYRNWMKMSKNNEVRKDIKRRQKLWHRNGTKNNSSSIMLLEHWYAFVKTFRHEEVCRRRDLCNILLSALDPPQGRTGWKTTTLVETMRSSSVIGFIKIHQAVLEKMLKMHIADGQTTDDGLTTASSSFITIVSLQAHLYQTP